MGKQPGKLEDAIATVAVLMLVFGSIAFLANAYWELYRKHEASDVLTTMSLAFALVNIVRAWLAPSVDEGE
jgi:hypothetical protein